MNSMNRRDALTLTAAAGAAVLAGAAAAPEAAAQQPKDKRPKGNAEPAVESTTTAERYGPRELFAVVDADGSLKRGLHAVSSQCLQMGLYEVIFNRDVRRGVYLATPGGPGYSGVPLPAAVSVQGRATDPRGVLVYVSSLEGDPLTCGFHLLVVCPEGFA